MRHRGEMSHRQAGGRDLQGQEKRQGGKGCRQKWGGGCLAKASCLTTPHSNRPLQVDARQATLRAAISAKTAADAADELANGEAAAAREAEEAVRAALRQQHAKVCVGMGEGHRCGEVWEVHTCKDGTGGGRGRR